VLGTAVPLPVAPVAAVDVVPNDDGQVPTPAETVAWYLGSLRKGKRHAKQTIKSVTAVLNRAVRELGADDWDPWVATSRDTGSWAWWSSLMTLEATPQPMKDATRGRYTSILHAFWASCTASDATTADGRRYSRIPDFMPSKYRPAEQTPTELIREGITRSAEHVTPFTIEEVRAMLATVDAVGFPEYFRIAVHVLAKTGMNPADVYAMFMKGGTFEWDRKDGVVWYHSVRTKTATPIDVPLGPSRSSEGAARTGEVARTVPPHVQRYDGVRARGPRVCT
jgi:hypothetical protein